MNRDAIVATFIGFGVGLVITGIFLLGPGFAKNFPKINLPKISFPQKLAKTTPSPTPTPTTLSIQAPLPESIENNDKILVSGSSSAASVVVIEGPLDEIVIKANGDGKYAGKISLTEGFNNIIVTSYAQGQLTQKTVEVFYTPEKL